MKNVNEVVDIILKDIASGIKKEWNKLEIIRFVYLKVGKYLEKNTDFFLNDKLESLKISDEDIKRIYTDDKIAVANRNNNYSYQIICKSAALVLKGIFDRLNIKSTMVHTCGKEDEIRHWFLVVSDDNYKQYYLTLAADLPYIKNEFPTHHFANSIPYFNITQNSISKNEDKSKESLNKVKDRILKSGKNLNEYIVFKSKDNHYIIMLKEDLPKIKINNNNINYMELQDNIDIIFQNGNIVNLVTRQYDIPDDVKLKHTVTNVDDFVFEYDEIDYTVLLDENDKDISLRDIDNNIGYCPYQYENLVTDKRFNISSYITIEENSDVFKILIDSLNLKGTSGKKVSEITVEEAISFKNNLMKYIIDSINIKFKTYVVGSFKSSEEYVREYMKIIIDKFNIANIDLNKDINTVMRSARKKIKEPEYLDVIDLFSMVMNVEARFDKYIKIKIELEELMKIMKYKISLYHQKSENKDLNNEIIELYNRFNELVMEYDNVSKNLSILKLNPLLRKIAHYFTKDKVIIDKESKYIPTEYIYNKFCLMFPLVFDCSYGENIKDINTPFSNQGYSEQVVIIKELIRKIFSEVKEANCYQCEIYSNKYSPIENRIRIFPLKDKETGEYIIGFRFWAMNPNYQNEEEINMIYIPSENLLREYSLNDRSRYLIVSSSLSQNIEKKEDIEENESKIAI